MSPGRIVAVEGASAAGKTRTTTAVGAATGGVVLPEAYRRLVPTPSLEFTSRGALLRLESLLLAEEGRRFREARAARRAGHLVIADTGFLGPLTYTWGLVRIGDAAPSVLSALVSRARALTARGGWGVADVYVYLDAPSRVRSARARADPEGAPPDLARRHRAVAVHERKFYRERFAPLFGARFRWLDGDRPPAAVARSLESVARESASLLPARVPPDRVLELFGD
jgi:hypothetical protein